MENKAREVNEITTNRKKSNYTLMGVIVAVLMLFAVLVTAFEAVIYSPTYYIQIASENKTQEKLGINIDEYRYFYNSLISYLSTGDQTQLENTFGSGEEERPMFTEAEKACLGNVHTALFIFSLLRWAALAASLVLLGYVLFTAQKIGLIHIGKSMFLTLVVLIVFIITCLLFARQHLDGIIHFAGTIFIGDIQLAENLTLPTLLPKPIYSNVFANWAKMSAIFTIFPVLISIGMARLTLVKKDDQDDYLYQ